jgi:hypothetical protein
MSRATVVLFGSDSRDKVAAWAKQAPPGTRVDFKAPRRTLAQNARMWCLLTAVASQVPWHGSKLTAEDWKLIFLDALKREVRTAPSIDGDGVVSLGRSTSDLSKDEMGDLMTIIEMFGAKHGVRFEKNEDAEQ